MRTFVAAAAFAAVLAPGAVTAPAPQCGDGRDNDGDRLVDARFDSGCTNRSDGTEASPFTCSLGNRALSDGRYSVSGRCSGTFGAVEVTAPGGATLDTRVTPTAEHSTGCRFVSERKLVCSMEDGVGNPTHAVRLRFGFDAPVAAAPTVAFRDHRDRPLRWAPAGEGPGSGGGSTGGADLRVDVSGPTDFTLDRDYATVDYVVYRLSVWNAGPSDVPPGAVLRIAAHGLYQPLHVTPRYGVSHCTKHGCTLRGLDRNQRAEIRLELGLKSPQKLQVDIELANLRVPDPVKLNNSDTIRTEVNPMLVDVALQASAPARVLRNISTGRWSIPVSVGLRNLGPSPAIAGDVSVRIQVHTTSVFQLERISAGDLAVSCERNSIEVFTCAVPPPDGYVFAVSFAMERPGTYLVSVDAIVRGGLDAKQSNNTASVTVEAVE